jgi:very-short-patch-repair endonuclease
MISSGFWQSLGITQPTPEFKFHPTRKWRIDYAWPDIKLAVEIEGAIWKNGRHTRGSGFSKDIEKYNMLTELGWQLLRYEPSKIDYLQIKRIVGLKYHQ